MEDKKDLKDRPKDEVEKDMSTGLAAGSAAVTVEDGGEIAKQDPPAAAPAHVEEALGEGMVQEVARKVKYMELYRYATGFDWFLMVIGMICAAISGALLPFTTIVFGNLVNSFSVSFTDSSFLDLSPVMKEKFYLAWRDNLLSDVKTNTLFFLYLAAITFVTTYIYMAIFVATGEKITHRMREQYLRAVLRQDITWHEVQGAGEISTRITSDMLLIQDAISEKVPIAATQIFTFIAAFSIAFYRSARLTGVLLCAVPLIVLSVAVMNVISAKLQRNILTSYSKAGTVAEECISAVRTVAALNAQDKMSRRYTTQLQGAVTWGIRKSVVTGLGTGILFMIIYLAYSLAFYYGSILLQTNGIDAGSVVNVFFAILIGAFALGQIAPELQAFALGVGAGSKILHTLDRVPDIDAIGAPKAAAQKPRELSSEAFKRCTGKITFKKVDFVYPSRKDVQILKNLNLSFEAGATTALVGLSGSGKSTIIQLIERFYDPIEGTVELDGEDIKSKDLLWLRRQIGLVSQEPTLFEGTIAENVARGLIGTPEERLDKGAKLELVKNACVMANAHEFISRLPNGYSTQVGERGFMLSGGQKQRIAIARAIIKNPQILLLDEATSALDTVSERIVQQALDNAAKGRTTVCIAHRLSTIKNADRIVVMSRGGVIVEQGTHDHLMTLEGGIYRGLVEAQQLQKGEEKKDGEPEEEIDPDAVLDQVVVEDETGAVEIKKSLFDLSKSEKKGDLEGGKSEQYKITNWHVIKEVYRLNKPELTYTITGLVAATIAGLVIPFFAIVFSRVIEAFSAEEPRRTNDIRFWASMFVVIAFVTAVTNFIQNTMFGIANEKLTDRIRRLLFRAILRQDMAFFSATETPKAAVTDAKSSKSKKKVQDAPVNPGSPTRSTGSLTASLSTDAQKLQGAAGVTLGTALQLMATLFGGAIVALVYGWKLALVGFTTLPILVGAGAFRIMALTYFASLSEKAHSKSAQVACEGVAAIRTVQSLTAEDSVHERYLQMLEGPLKDGYKAAFTTTSFYALSQCANFLGNALVFWYGGQLIAFEKYNVQNFFVVFIAVIFGSISAGRVFAFVPDVTKARSAGEAILTVLERQPAIDIDSEKGERLYLPSPSHPEGAKDTATGRIELKDVWFTYESEPEAVTEADAVASKRASKSGADLAKPTGKPAPVLRGLNLTVEPGQFVALVGPSGCGKSTVLALLERFYDPESGKVLIDGKDVKELRLRDLRSVVAIVSQEPGLFDMSVEENILLGLTGKEEQEGKKKDIAETSKDGIELKEIRADSPTTTDTRVEKAAKEANVHDFVSSLPDGYKTTVGTRGSKLSGGQKQRVAIARALIGEPKVLLLDEATSALDAESEKVVQDALDRAAKGRTTIAVAHRLSSIQHADVIFVLKDGVVAEKGTHKELYSKHGLYYELAVQQNLDVTSK
ncbi:GTPase-activating protein [Phlyctochytrium planicorne]|nr:GTPase-activating protein [Phlyctochytrium planicorne]